MLNGYMMWVALLYAVVGSWLTHQVGAPLTGLNFNQQRYEADFRFGLVRVRENAESIAAYAGEADEKRALTARFFDVWNNFHKLMTYRKRLTWFITGYHQMAIIFPIMVVAPRYFAGLIEFGIIFQTSSAFGQVQGALSWFVSSYSEIARWRATLDRLTSFHAAIEAARTEATSGQGIARESSTHKEFAFSDTTIQLPDGEVLLGHVSAVVRPGENTLVTGPSGIGKSTLFRALSGIWPFGSGVVKVPAAARVLFLPQRPYLPIGSLRDAVAYPTAGQGFDDATLKEVLTACQLPAMAERLNEVDHWAQRLSTGEQQRIAFARALLNRPDWLFLDEATSALDETMERELYGLLAQRLPNTTLVSIAHRPSVGAFHQHRLALVPDPLGTRVVSEML